MFGLYIIGNVRVARTTIQFHANITNHLVAFKSLGVTA